MLLTQPIHVYLTGGCGNQIAQYAHVLRERALGYNVSCSFVQINGATPRQNQMPGLHCYVEGVRAARSIDMSGDLVDTTYTAGFPDELAAEVETLAVNNPLADICTGKVLEHVRLTDFAIGWREGLPARLVGDVIITDDPARLQEIFPDAVVADTTGMRPLDIIAGASAAARIIRHPASTFLDLAEFLIIRRQRGAMRQ